MTKTCEDKVQSNAGLSAGEDAVLSTGEDVENELCAATDEQNSDGPPAEKKPCIGEID